MTMSLNGAAQQGIDKEGSDAIWYVYALQCSDNSIYLGITNDLPRRLRQHAGKAGSKYVRSRLPFTLIGHHTVQSKSAALRDEHAIRKLNHRQKLARFAPKASRHNGCDTPNNMGNASGQQAQGRQHGPR